MEESVAWYNSERESLDLSLVSRIFFYVRGSFVLISGSGMLVEVVDA